MQSILTWGFLIAACLLLFSDSPVDAVVCSIVPPQRSSVLRVAIVVHGPPLSNASGPAEMIPVNPCMLTTPYSSNPYDGALFQAIQLYDEKMKAYGGLPLSDGTHMPFEFYYFNLGPGGGAAANPALYIMRANNLAAQLANDTGLYGRFPAIITPAFTGGSAKDVIQLAFFDACERSMTCFVVGAAIGDPIVFICPTPNSPDCIARNRVSGSRRFMYGVSNFPDPTYDLQGQMSWFGIKQLKSVGLIFDQSGNNADTYARTIRLAPQSNLQVTWKILLPPSGQFSDLGTSITNVADDLIAANPDTLLIGVAGNQPPGDQVAKLLAELIDRGWWPQGIGFSGNVDVQMAPSKYLPKGTMWYTIGMVPWSPLFRGSNFQAINVTGVNFELYGATDTDDSPQVFVAEMTRRFGPPADDVATYIFAAAYTGALITIQKLVEMTQNDDAPTWATLAPTMSSPSVWGLLQFDPWGRRTVGSGAANYQNQPDGSKAMVYPFNLNAGFSPQLPIPSFADRTWESYFAKSAGERAMFAVTALVIVYALVLTVYVYIKRNEGAIRAATPLFCGIILGGCIVTLISNFFLPLQNSMPDTANHLCAAQWWFLTLGITLFLNALLIKTARISIIFSNVKKLKVTKLKASHLLLPLAAVLVIDIIVNAIWTATGSTHAQLIVPDAYRPALNYYQCQASADKPFLITHLVLKGISIMAGMTLSYRVRDVDQRFNESRLIMYCIYNLCSTLFFGAVMITLHVAGTRITELIQGFFVIFLCGSTMSILFLPKIFIDPVGPSNATYIDTPSLQPTTANVPTVVRGKPTAVHPE